MEVGKSGVVCMLWLLRHLPFGFVSTKCFPKVSFAKSNLFQMFSKLDRFNWMGVDLTMTLKREWELIWLGCYFWMWDTYSTCLYPYNIIQVLDCSIKKVSNFFFGSFPGDIHLSSHNLRPRFLRNPFLTSKIIF